MRIFTAVRHSQNPDYYYGGLWSGNFYPALRQLGHELIESQVDLLPASRFMHIASQFTTEELEVRAQITQAIIDELKRAHSENPIDLLLSYFYNSHFDPDGFAEISRLGIPTINFYCNSIYQFDFVSAISAKVDFAWHAERDAKSLYEGVGANPVWVQMGADPDVYRPLERHSRTGKACFVGQRYADRDRWMAALVRAEVPLVIYGPGWSGNGLGTANSNGSGDKSGEYLGRKTPAPQSLASYSQMLLQNLRQHGLAGGMARSWRQNQYRLESHRLSPLFESVAQGPIPFEEIRKVFSSHEVILNFSNVWADGRPGSRLIAHVRLRDFEAPMCRTCYLTEYTDELAEFYELEKEIVTYRSPEELVNKTRYYLAHAEEAERIREAGYRRALRDHTWAQRFRQLFSTAGLSN